MRPSDILSLSTTITNYDDYKLLGIMSVPNLFIWGISMSVRRENRVHDGPTFQFLTQRCLRSLKVRWSSV